ncbi:HNH endonuclease [Labilibaculum antarcticum]|uniref:Uncharacterized protein n=1 Tax=Labilibaculum antarcticum TaxID=1717717 RepID=A0A1Y1CKK9_9BACT|nr:HNH endonuclease [Labilibaculum antarcticum]BAX80840.1 hypothetical protein ALGA_2518 [Labilibaculum antarcticum]
MKITQVTSAVVMLLILSACTKTTLLKKILGKESKELAELVTSESAEKIVGNSNMSDLILISIKSLDGKLSKKLTRDIAENKSLVDLFNANPGLIKIWKKIALSSVSSNAKYLNYLNSLPSDKFLFEVSEGGVLSVFDNSKRELAKLFPDKVIAKSGLKFSDNLLTPEKYIWNDLLNGKLISNHLYKVDSWFYRTDKLARVSSIHGSVFQPKPALIIDKAKGIASIPNGPWEQISQLKMSPDVIKKEWKIITEEWAVIIKNKGKVNFKITPFYNKSSKEVYQHVVEYTNKEGRFVKKTLKNMINSMDNVVSKQLSDFGLNPDALKEFQMVFKGEHADELLRDFTNNVKNDKIIKWFNANPDLIKGYYKLMELSPSIRVNKRNIIDVTRQIESGAKEIFIGIPGNIGKKKVGKILKYDVEFKERIIPIGNFKFKAVFPDFSAFSIAKIRLEDVLIQAVDGEQFTFAKEVLKKQFKSNPDEIIKMLKKHNSRMVKEGKVNIFKGDILSEKEMLSKQIADIEGKGSSVFGFIWHHNEEYGILELVSHDVHVLHKHTGGKIVWNGGGANR